MSARVVILGAGFAGLAALQSLCGRTDLSVLVVDRSPHAVFSPLLPDLLSGRVRAEHMVHPLAAHCRRRGARFLRAEVCRILPELQRVELSTGTVAYDYAVVCVGCENNYYGNERARKHATGLKTLQEGRLLRAGLNALVDRLEGDSSPAAVAVVGGGYTGFECASHAAYHIHRRTGIPYDDLPARCPVVVVEQADAPLRNCSCRVRSWSLDLLNRFGVEVRTNCSVEEFRDDGVALTDGTELPGALTMWCAGVTPGEAAAALDAPKLQGGRLQVDPYLRLPGGEHLYAAGDVAGATSGDAEEPLRLAVQFALAAGHCAARNIMRAIDGEPLVPFQPMDLGYVLPLAPGRGAGVVLGEEIVGRVPSLLHYLFCTLRSRSWENALGILQDLRQQR